MRSIRHKTLFAAAFVFAAGFASTASAGSCIECMDIYNACMTATGGDYGVCAHQHNLCAAPQNCPLMPEIIID
ncbi:MULTISPECIES: hypothetical protein [Lysobacter]|jgi:hypothetical protein|uniref:Lipoprotein n=1 Tax=Lysobacter capsici AZ78 TaxID=1444315 RepID=A0A125MN57_9GAMM|nr:MULTISPECIES: hypothetical protein [Lysobacter]ATE74345.1 hypothetical protein CNO08_25105 [Lysobacter capsici]KRB07778.1 hypothetical protein ASD86_08125 [Lysobacter sp. Root690]KWS05511.1 hypothetical protein AZ78_3063 [Lysobacter capsici AZ78]UOF15026.1 hypothetical protein IEQ11_25520 [Lysobacter capsici]WND80731.1 hypothetical protein RJ610_26215 [Lysobacter capsici]